MAATTDVFTASTAEVTIPKNCCSTESSQESSLGGAAAREEVSMVTVTSVNGIGVEKTTVAEAVDGDVMAAVALPGTVPPSTASTTNVPPIRSPAGTVIAYA
jgi:hypothetical protein